MIVKLQNSDEKFYQYMGKFFGSRLVERQTNDRIYDDTNKEWYIYLEGKKAVSFVSIQKNRIKNIYTTKEEYLERILERIKKENNITNSVVTNAYKDIYERCGFLLKKNSNFKNFITIYMKQEDDKKLATV